MDPAADSLAIIAMRARMDSIHRNCHRPTVALVLSGGGAKGAATIGALRYLEEQQIPVDFVVGTSIGGLVGGLYSMGYRTDEMIALFREQDWLTTLSDNVDPSFIPYNRRVYKEKYLVPISFSDRKDIEERLHRSDSHQSHNGEPGSKPEVGSLASSLPSGLVYGFNVNNLFSSLTVGYQDDQSFMNLPVPFFAVASDVVSCKAKNWSSGSLCEALRSTMSIPGLFDPVRTGRMVLVDGGTRNNFPTDIAKAMGADYIIGVDLSDLDPEYEQINNLGDVLMQFITMLGADSFNRNVTAPDVFIKPDIKEYNMLSFNADAINVMYDRGYAAAKAQAEAVEGVKRHMNGDLPRLSCRKATNLAVTKVMLGGVEFEGVDEEESRMLMEEIGLKVGTRVGRDELNDAMSILQGSGAFESISYSLYGSDEPYRLVFHCKLAPANKVALGLRMDTEQWAAIALNLGINANKLMGPKMDVDVRLGQSQRLDAHYYLEHPGLPMINASLSLYRYNYYFVGTGPVNRKDELYCGHKEMMYLSSRKWLKGDAQLGFQNRQYIPLNDRSSSNKANMAGPFLKVARYTMDNRYFPSSGSELSFGSQFDFLMSRSYAYTPVADVWFNWRAAVPMGSVFTFIPSFHARSVLDYNEGVNYSLGHRNFVGGFMAGRYIEQQIPFVGWNNVYLASDHVVVSNLDFRFRLSHAMYLSALGGFMREADSALDMFRSSESARSFYAAGLMLGMDTMLGPVRADLRWSSLAGVQAGISVGFDF